MPETVTKTLVASAAARRPHGTPEKRTGARHRSAPRARRWRTIRAEVRRIVCRCCFMLMHLLRLRLLVPLPAAGLDRRGGPAGLRVVRRTETTRPLHCPTYAETPVRRGATIGHEGRNDELPPSGRRGRSRETAPAILRPSGGSAQPDSRLLTPRSSQLHPLQVPPEQKALPLHLRLHHRPDQRHGLTISVPVTFDGDLGPGRYMAGRDQPVLRE